MVIDFEYLQQESRTACCLQRITQLCLHSSETKSSDDLPQLVFERKNLPQLGAWRLGLLHYYPQNFSPRISTSFTFQEVKAGTCCILPSATSPKFLYSYIHEALLNWPCAKYQKIGKNTDRLIVLSNEILREGEEKQSACSPHLILYLRSRILLRWHHI